jgi:hypothetical protein
LLCLSKIRLAGQGPLKGEQVGLAPDMISTHLLVNNIVFHDSMNNSNDLDLT